MGWLFKALLVAGTVLLVMWVARQGGRRLAGVDRDWDKARLLLAHALRS